MHCCDGKDVTPRPRGSLAPTSEGLPPLAPPNDDGSGRKWATVTDSAAYLQRVCTALKITRCPAELGGKKVAVDSSLPADDGSEAYRVFVPSQQTAATTSPDHALMEEAYFNLPSLALFESHTNTQRTVAVESGLGSDIWNVDRYHGVVVRATDPNRVGDVSVGQFVDLVRWNLTLLSPAERLTRLTQRVNTLIQQSLGGADVTYYVSDVPIESWPRARETCTDNAFVDDLGFGCSDYETNNWCTHSGYPTNAGCEAWASNDPPYTCVESDPQTPRGKDGGADGQQLGTGAAGVSCCHCGGGTHTLPDGFAVMPPAPAPAPAPEPQLVNM